MLHCTSVVKKKLFDIHVVSRLLFSGLFLIEWSFDYVICIYLHILLSDRFSTANDVCHNINMTDYTSGACIPFLS